MSQRSTLRAIDAEMFAAFAGAGLGDTGTHRTRDGIAMPVMILHDDIAPDVYTEGPVNVGVRKREIVLLRAEVEAIAGETVEIDDTGETLRLLSISDQDSSIVRWSVTPVRSEGQ
jgi:hypothetical protein